MVLIVSVRTVKKMKTTNSLLLVFEVLIEEYTLEYLPIYYLNQLNIFQC